MAWAYHRSRFKIPQAELACQASLTVDSVMFGGENFGSVSLQFGVAMPVW